jgi:hypothetical protein
MTESSSTASLRRELGVFAAMILCGDVRLTWSFSAFTVLVYYAATLGLNGETWPMISLG